MSEINKEYNVADFFGCNVFSDKVMRERLPRDVYRAVRKTKKLGCPLAPEIAGAVAHAMKEWAIEKGATHYTHWFQPMTGVTAEKHDAFLNPAERCFILPLRRTSLHLRGKRLHRMGSYLKRLRKGRLSVHSYCLHFIHRRNSRQEDSPPPFNGGAQ